MAWFADLTPCYYFTQFMASPEDAPRLLAIGWLQVEHEFPTGPVPDRAVGRLKVLLENAWCPIEFMGGYTCSLCLGRVETHARPDMPSSFGNLLVPGDGCVYVTTELITHYIQEHRYAPPMAFWAAVESCPSPRSEEYHAALLREGPVGLRNFLA